MTTALTQPAAPSQAAESTPAETFARKFRRIFNFTTVALVFWLCFTFVVASLLKLLAVMSLEEWLFMVAYLTRQFLASGLLALAATALGSALLPERLGPRVRWPAMVVLLVIASSLSAFVRLWMSRYPMTSPRETASWFVDVVVLWTVIGVMAYGLIGSIGRQAAARRRLGQQIAERSALAASALEARLTVLQAQIEPHFLFNTLANVRRLCEVDRERGRNMLGSLLEYLRAALPAMRRSSTALAQEFDLVRAYLSVLQQRMGERLRFELELSDRLGEVQIPPLILPTLVENAIRHGLGPLPEGGTIRVRACREGDQVLVSVADDGAGFQGTSGSGVGLANTRARLAARFGGTASLELRSNEPRGVVVEVRLPADRVQAAPELYPV
ncbi:MAG: histidine kinase [Burkholderiaceae bacterium]|nr:histidine kinase [Burkholderiaceae bacterium]